jgi:hypothetical protein
MHALSPQDLKDIYNSLPEDLRNAIFASESMDVYNQIQARYALDANQREELSIQSGLLMMGITEPKEYVLVLAEKLGIPRDKAAFIAQEVNREVLHPVRDSLKAIHQSGTPGVAPVPAPAPVRAPATVPVPPSVPQSTFNQKLGGAFRVETPPQAEVPNYGASSVPTPVPAPVPMPPVPQPAPRASDPYREPPM